MGPWIETDADLDEMVPTVRLNGRELIRFPPNVMIFGVQKYISEMPKYMPLYPGDVIWMGTDGAAENMKPGDVCEVEISGVGILTNPIIGAVD